ncbi:unnamed protein product [Lymnaea stagnalis]|uniref:Uncharacterized protein n=1 Tax=Lymnaea stagnalis TaxID=6523 RepID=A0AAV2H0X2_LYMST
MNKLRIPLHSSQSQLLSSNSLVTKARIFRAVRGMSSQNQSQQEGCQQPPYFQLDRTASMETPLNLQVQGTIPKWLEGSLYRNGSGVYRVGSSNFQHLFDGFAVVSRWTIQNGSVSFLSSIVDTDTYKKAVKHNALVGSTFGSNFPDPCKSIFSRFFSHFLPRPPKKNDNVGISIIKCGERFFALTESSMIHELNGDDLHSVQKIDVSKHFPVQMGTGHPHFEKDGTMLYYATNLRDYNKAYNFIRVPPPSGGVDPWSNGQILASVASRWKMNIGYTHSFGLTENYIVHFEQPLACNVLKILTMEMRSSSFEDTLVNYPGEPVSAFLLDKKTGERTPITYLAPHGFTFHFINCYEDAGHVVVDVCLSEDAQIIKDLYIDAILKRQQQKTPLNITFGRFVLPLSLDKAEPGKNLVTLSNTNASAVLREKGKNIVDVRRDTSFDDTVYFDLPRINYDYNGLKYRYTYGSSIFNTSLARVSLKIDVLVTFLTYLCGTTHIPGEPVFVKSPEGTLEDDGVILSAILAQTSDQSSYLVVLDASSFKEVARATLPSDIKINFSFHGDFYF